MKRRCWQCGAWRGNWGAKAKSGKNFSQDHDAKKRGKEEQKIRHLMKSNRHKYAKIPRRYRLLKRKVILKEGARTT